MAGDHGADQLLRDAGDVLRRRRHLGSRCLPSKQVIFVHWKITHMKYVLLTVLRAIALLVAVAVTGTSGTLQAATIRYMLDRDGVVSLNITRPS